MAEEIEVKEIFAVGNKIASEIERNFINEQMKKQGVPVIADVPYDNRVAEADMKGIPVIDLNAETEAVKTVIEIKKFLLNRYKP
jgi:CO dehydrogenase nickel-insertion accessory protein CooC1